MRRAGIILAVICFLSGINSSRAEWKDGNDSIKGGFKECRVYKYSYNEGKPDSVPGVLDQLYRYNDKGIWFENIEYKPDGTILAQKNRTFDSIGNLKLNISKSNDENKSHKYVYEYNDSGKIISEILEWSNGTYGSVRYKNDKNGKEVLSTFYRADSIITRKTFEKYNIAGKNIKSIVFSMDGQLRIVKLLYPGVKRLMLEDEPDTSRGYSKTEETYSYDLKGNMLEEVHIYTNIDMFHSYKKTYKFDEAGNMIEIISSDIKGNEYDKHIYKYDWDNKMIEAYYYSDNSENVKSVLFYFDHNRYSKTYLCCEDSSLYYTGSTKYDAGGKEVEQEFYRIDGHFEGFWYEKYDNKGNKIEYFTHFPEYNDDIQNTFKFDEKGNKIEEVNYWFGKRKTVSKTSWKYDEYGNLIEYIYYKKYEEPEKTNWLNDALKKLFRPELYNESTGPSFKTEYIYSK